MTKLNLHHFRSSRQLGAAGVISGGHSVVDVVRAWKDPAYRASLSPEERGELPEHPSGDSWNELGEDGLDRVSGGFEDPGFDFPVNSGVHICTATAECPIASVCCP